MLRKISCYKLILLSIFFLLAWQGKVLAEDYNYQSPQEKPLLVIRFIDAEINFHQYLYDAVGRALQIKPTAFFDLVSLVPERQQEYKNKKYQKEAETNMALVLQRFEEMGVGKSNIRITYQSEKNVNMNEVYIFVQ